MPALDRILVIKHSALGDFIHSIASFQAIRAHHDSAKITLLTTAPFGRMAKQSGCFDEIWLDERPRWLRPDLWWRLIRELQVEDFQRVYDLQRSDRTRLYLRLLGKRVPEWVGVAPEASHRYQPPLDHPIHIEDREAEQLAMVGVERAPYPDLSYITANLERLQLPARYAMLIPGSSPKHPVKRWPPKQYAKLAAALATRGVTPLLIGRDEERPEIELIKRVCPKARDLCGDTSLEDLAVMARSAAVAVGNDTGPTQLVAAAGAPTIALFSTASNPIRSSPRGPWVRVCEAADLADLTLGEVMDNLPDSLREDPNKSMTRIPKEQG
ncbi:MAG: glycosyltransferase family 9 protein [Pseudomonadota bacterium]